MDINETFPAVVLANTLLDVLRKHGMDVDCLELINRLSSTSVSCDQWNKHNLCQAFVTDLEAIEVAENKGKLERKD